MAEWTGLRRTAPQIPDELWEKILQACPFLTWRGTQDIQTLKQLSAEFLRRKEFHGARGFKVTDEIALTVAAQACLPVLHLGLQAYEGFVGVVMHDGPVLARREVADEAGLVHTFAEELVGEAVDGGPVMLSWAQGVAPCHDGVASGPSAPVSAFNVVIHEFVHLLDLLDGEFDGTPPLPAAKRGRWQAVLQASFDRFDERSACGYASVVDAYGAQDVGEFFAVTAEAFFTAPVQMQDELPELYSLYAEFFRQDPAAGFLHAAR